MLQEPSVSIVVPVYNEEESIIETIERIRKTMKADGRADYELIVVDDASTDNTGKLLQESDIHVITHKINRGYGAALKKGIRAARGEIIVITDADGSYPIENIPLLLKDMVENDMVVGARTGLDVNIPWIRRIPKFILQALASYVVRYPIPDLNSGLRAFRKKIAFQYFHIIPSGFSFTSTITMAMLAADYNVKFIPMDYYPRAGRSKISPWDVGSFFTMIIRTCLYFSPLRVFAPLSGFFFAATIIKLIYDYFYRPVGWFVISQSVLVLSLVAVQIFVLGLVADLIVRRTNGD